MLKLRTIAAIGMLAGLYGTAAQANTPSSVTHVNLPSSMPVNSQLDRSLMYADWRGGRMDRMRGGPRAAGRGGPRAGGGGPRARGGGGPRARGGGGPRMRGGGGPRRVGDRRWRGDRRYYRGGRYRDRYYNNWGWVIPAAAVTAATIAATSNRGSNQAYSCQARYGKYYYQGSYQPGGPCYINVNGRMIGVSNYRAN